MKDFVNFGVKEREVFVIHDLFKSLQETMPLGKGEVAEEHEYITLRRFNLEYLTQNKACVIRGYANQWKALSKWTDFNYL